MKHQKRNNIKIRVIAIFLLFPLLVMAQNRNCFKVTGLKEKYDAYKDCVSFKVANHCDSTIRCGIAVQKYILSDRKWVETWPDIYLEKITSCKPPCLLFEFPADSTIELQWCPRKCIDYFGEKWIAEKKSDQENKKVRLCRFKFHFHIFLGGEIEESGVYYSKPFCIYVN